MLAPAQQMPTLDPLASNQRNSIARTMMNVANPPPQVRAPVMPQQPLMGMPQQPAPGGPPSGAPVPQQQPMSLPLSPGVPPQAPASPMSGTLQAQPMQPARAY